MKNLLLVLSLAFALQVSAQVPKNVVVEHFTNSLCGICSFKNPPFYTNLEAHPDILHLSIHPSSPYATCIFNLHQVAENDARTNYYGLYGGTPRFTINGNNISAAADLSSPALFTPYTGQLSPASLKVTQLNFGTDSITVTVKITTEAAHSLGALKLFVALSEDTVFYNAPNGETEHYDVFRKSLSAADGLSVTLPAAVGASVEYTFSASISSVWELDRISPIAILQEAGSKDVVQAERGTQGCNAAIAPTGLSSFVSASSVQLSWNSVPESVGCQVSGGPVPSFGASSNILGFEVNTTSFPTSILAPGTYNVRLRCACEISPTVVVTPFSATNFFVISASKQAAPALASPKAGLESK